MSEETCYKSKNFVFNDIMQSCFCFVYIFFLKIKWNGCMLTILLNNNTSAQSFKASFGSLIRSHICNYFLDSDKYTIKNVIVSLVSWSGVDIDLHEVPGLIPVWSLIGQFNQMLCFFSLSEKPRKWHKTIFWSKSRLSI